MFRQLRRHFCESRTSSENGQILIFENMHNLLDEPLTLKVKSFE